MLEVDDEGGRMFLRVLIHLTMHDYPPLISGSLQLLFKHFSQRQEVLHTFKQVRASGTPHAWRWVGDVGWILALSLGREIWEWDLWPQLKTPGNVTAGPAPDLSPGCGELQGDQV